MTKRKFYIRTWTTEVISETPIPPGMSTEEILQEATSGEYSMREFGEKNRVVNGKRAAQILLTQGSDTSFFHLDENGNDEE